MKPFPIRSNANVSVELETTTNRATYLVPTSHRPWNVKKFYLEAQIFIHIFDSIKKTKKIKTDCSWKATRSQSLANLLILPVTKPDPLPRHDLTETEGRGPEWVHRLTNTYKYVSERWINGGEGGGSEEGFHLPTQLTHPPHHCKFPSPGGPVLRWGASPANQIT